MPKIREIVRNDPKMWLYMYRVGSRVEKLAKVHVHVRSGLLQRSIRTEVKRTRRMPTAKVGSSKRYARVHHDGASPHDISAKNGEFLIFSTGRSRASRGGKPVYKRKVHHKGHAGTHYLTKALREASLRYE